MDPEKWTTHPIHLESTLELQINIKHDLKPTLS